MIFRPLFWPSFFALPSLLVLLMLGTWQVNRLQWKTELINAFKERSQSEAIYPDFTGDVVEFQRVVLDGRFDHENTIYLTGRTYEGNAGFHVVSAFETNKGDVFFINRGWVSEAYREPEKRPFSMTKGTVQIEGIVRLPQRQGYFVPDNEPQAGFWFTMKPDEVATYLSITQAQTGFYIDAIRDPNAKLTLPIAAEVKIDVRNSHLNYAVTWYGIALSLIGVYLAYHHSVGRLSFGRARKNTDPDKENG